MRDPNEAVRDLGLPEDIRFQGLAVCQSARCVVVTAGRRSDHSASQRLFVRPFGASAYAEIPWPVGCNSFRDPVVSQSAPTLHVLGECWRDNGGEPIGLYRVALPGTAAELIQGAKFDGGWISGLVGLGADASTLCVVRALATPDGPNTSISYSVCLLETRSGSFRLLTDLPAIFA